MAHVKDDLVQQTSTSTGAGALALTGVVARRFPFSIFPNGSTFYVTIENASAEEVETCLATLVTGSPNTITRGTLIKSTTGSRINFSGGVKTITLVGPASTIVTMDPNGDATVTRDLAAGRYLNATSGVAVGGTPLTKATFYGDAVAYSTSPYGDSGNNGQLIIAGASNPLRRLGIGVDTSSVTMISIIQSMEAGVAPRDLAINPSGGRVGLGGPPFFAGHVYGEASATTFGDSDNNGQLVVTGKTNNAKRLAMGVDTASGTMVAVIQSMEAGIAPRELKLNPAGGIVSVGGLHRPAEDNALSSGDGSHRWSVVYAGTGTINTSGRDAKIGIRGPSDAERRAARRILDIGPKLYKFRDAVDAKGEAARLHAGYIAEDVRDALEAEGLDPWSYGFMCADAIVTRETYTEQVSREKKRQVTGATEQVIDIRDGKPTLITKPVERWETVGSMVDVVDEAGAPVLVDGKPMQHFVPEMETVQDQRAREVPLLDDAGQPVMRLGLRYSELEAFLRCADVEG